MCPSNGAWKLGCSLVTSVHSTLEALWQCAIQIYFYHYHYLSISYAAARPSQCARISCGLSVQVVQAYIEGRTCVSAPYGRRGSNAPWFTCWLRRYINCSFVCLLNRLPEPLLHCGTLSTFKKRLDCYLKNREIWLSCCELLSSCEPPYEVACWVDLSWV